MVLKVKVKRLQAEAFNCQQVFFCTVSHTYVYLQLRTTALFTSWNGLIIYGYERQG